ncbi:hypothetical protein [Caballeronia sordidicola]|nr:hypothetical protein [Caballeronia sordidicola]
MAILGKHIVTACMFTLMLGQAKAGTVAGTGGSTEVTQLMNNTELVQNTYQQAQQLQLQIQSALTDPNTPWSQTMQALTQLRDVVNTGEALGYDATHLEQKFQSLYPQYSAQSGTSMLNNLVNWTSATKSSVQSALMAGGMTVDQIKSEGSMIDTLRLKGQTALGQMQATQVGNAIAVEQVQQMRRLEQLTASQMQAHNAYLLGETAKEEQKAGANASFNTSNLSNWAGKGYSLSK